jgi:DNA replication protein DnaC
MTTDTWEDAMHPDLDSRLRHLRLSGMAATLPVRNQEAVRNNLAHVDFLDLLVEDELNRRRDRLLERRIKQAALPQMKTLDGFDWAFNADLPKALILDLCTARFVTDRTGVLFIGPPGIGKSHICLSLALTAIHAGHTVLYRSAFDLAEDLSEAAAMGARKEVIQKLTRTALLVVEDLGMRKLPATAAEDLLEILSRRYEVGATVISSNRPIEDWGVVLGDTAAAGAMLDRFLHHAEIVPLKGKSYRMHDRQQRHRSPTT